MSRSQILLLHEETSGSFAIVTQNRQIPHSSSRFQHHHCCETEPTKRVSMPARAYRVYWVVNVEANIIELYTQPTGPGNAPAYAKRDDYPTGTLVPVVLDGTTIGTIAVADVMS